MENHDDYLLYLENRIRLREESRSYRWTLPARLVWNMLYPSPKSSYEERFATIYAERSKQGVEDFKIISDSGLFEAEYACPWIEGDPNAALLEYLERWKSNIDLRKPRPGFHPGIYAINNPRCIFDPFAHYISSGMPAGPWSLPVIPRDTKPSSGEMHARTALHLHLYYTDQLDSLLERIARNRILPDLFVSVVTDDDREVVEKKLGSLGGTRVVVKKFANRGRNFGPLFTGFREIFSDYEIVGHLHTKRSPHLGDREHVVRWVNFMLANMLGEHEPIMDSIIAAMTLDKSLGLVFPDDPNVLGWFKSAPCSLELARRMKMERFVPLEQINFPAGSMFWFRTRALKPILDLKLAWEDYPPEPIHHDGTMLHALERMLPSIVQQAGFKVAVTHEKGTWR